MSDHPFHWESQRRTRLDGRLGGLFREHDREGFDVLSFVRRQPKTPHGLGAPFVCLGQVHHERHDPARERPMSVVWRLEHPMPGALLEEARIAG